MAPAAHPAPQDRSPGHRLPAGVPLAVVVLVAAAIVLVLASAQTGRSPTEGLGLRSVSSADRGQQSRDDVAPLVRRIALPSPRTPDAWIGTGDRIEPFVDLPGVDRPRAIRSPSGVVMPILEPRSNGWLVSTACQAVLHIGPDLGTPIGRAHVVLDPGHGGVEPGAVSPGGLLEKDLNLAVAREAARLLTEAGATVVLTRDGDHTMTAAARGLVANAIGPALLVSIHHNGGAEPGDGGPGTIVFTKGASPGSSLFGGLFHQTLTPLLEGAESEADARHQAWVEEIERYEEARMAHHRSVAARDQALVANGQVPPHATTTIPPSTSGPAEAGWQPGPVEVVVTTTVPATSDSTVAVPDTLAPPESPTGEAVPPFRWAGSGNAGVRAWVRPDGQDYLAVLRHSGPGPAALVEFLYLSNPAEEALLADPAFVAAEAAVLAEAVTRYLAGETGGSGFVADQSTDQPIGGSGGRDTCVEPSLE